MLRIGPHTYSAYSDGTDSPSQLVIKAIRAGLDCVGLSDHDTFAGWDETETTTSSTGVALIRGMKMSCAASGISMHSLTLLPGPSDEGFLTCIEHARESHATRTLKMVENLSADYPITWRQALAFASEERLVGRPHIVDALAAVGTFDDRFTASVKILHPSGSYYVHCRAPDPIEVVQLVLETGEMSVLAHPRTCARQQLLSESAIEDMKGIDLFSIERDHRDHAPEDHEAVDHTTKRLDLRIFGSSGCHGTGKPSHIGENLATPAIVDEAVERAHLGILHL